ncbi:SpoIID/LytB domain-containing protein [Anaerotignum lactatifermentans]|uniref:SpoIID/LytB domain-containing protein n=1 Tax=Anaerotignum lactatifermentans TaxID=160404 RepID=A0ABS2G8Y4_9FIRM|nr:SpoIID/LytB domain-containing protein [Anaerotignum lactatifermentans]MBM6828527.1 SpoIID/LytB domain-containing protein [Anaerotignum lactatifermentans]MBM6877934.1 SpoIID/LytB domain-containing protein [Anaerotignum lactatifermentans]MBM6950109.1 SpoIID/LytB domain-containing protein [Anaerotignum lactatifermentans]
MKFLHKKIFAAALAGVMLLSIPQAAFAYTVPSVIRVGLESVCKNAASSTIGDREILVGTMKNDRFYEAGSITSTGSFTVKPIKEEVILLDLREYQDEAENLADSLVKMGLDAVPAYLGDEDWSVYVRNASLSEVESASREDAERISGFTGYLLSSTKEDYLLVPADSDFAFAGLGADDTFSIQGKRYRGYLTFVGNGTTMTAVNIVGLEEYLYGVVPAEMPSSYEEEALKAQALAARTYAMTKLGAHTGSGYQLCDTTACQVYKGYSTETAKTNAVVDETAGEIICYNGSPIEAVFSASTGGYTENSENVWYNVVPYLRAVPELGEYGNNSWTLTLTLEQLNSLLQSKGENIGSARDIKITKLSTGGRIQELQIVGTKGTVTLTKENIRTYFSSACGSLPGKMFTINGKGGEIGVYGTASSTGTVSGTTSKSGLAGAMASGGITLVTEGTLSDLNGKNLSVKGSGTSSSASTSNGDYQVYSVDISTINSKDTFVFEGIGKGHGVGLSQNGAQYMAQQGYSYQDILKHYYTGVTIEG